jgi:AcrR family transcriptional regulator
VEARPQRADARRNRDRLLEAAVRAFSHDATTDGAAKDGPAKDGPAKDGQQVPLEAIARAAGVGIGTLYRHFPTREALVEAAYRSELDRLCDGVADLLAEQPAAGALRTWMDRFVAYMTTKRGMAQALQAVIASGGNPFAHSLDRLLGAIGELLDAGAAERTVRGDVPAADVLASLGGISLTAGDPSQRELAGRLLDLLMDGLRHRE